MEDGNWFTAALLSLGTLCRRGVTVCLILKCKRDWIGFFCAQIYLTFSVAESDHFHNDISLILFTDSGKTHRKEGSLPLDLY